MRNKIPQERLWIFPAVNRPVFIISAVLIVSFILFGAFFSELAGTIFNGMQTGLTTYLGWTLIILVNALLIFTVYLGLGPFGDIRLGHMDEDPEYDLFSWTAMLFSAGIGIGLIYWGVAEPMYHFFNPPRLEPETMPAAQEAMALTFMHWGFHAWAIYAVVALALAYFHYRMGLPLSIRSTLYPILGERIFGFWGDVVDTLAVFGTMFGIVTSLGLGAIQINDGLTTVFGIGSSVTVQIIVIALITGLATLSVIAGLDGGIKRLSNLNVCLSFVLLAFMLVVGPTLFIFDTFIDNYGIYLNKFIELGVWAEGWADQNWQNNWTLFYWAWWISWSPFVGIFVARISRGRTIREFVAGVMLLPCSIMFFWFTAFGSVAIDISLGGDRALIEATQEGYGNTMFALLEYFPLAGITSIFAVVLIILWFVTSSDSGSYVIDMLTAGGDPNPPRIQRVFWAISEGCVASVLLLAGGLSALQAAAVVAGFPFAIVIVLIAIGLYRALRWDPLMVHRHNLRYRDDVEADHNMPRELPGEGPGMPDAPAAPGAKASPAE